MNVYENTAYKPAQEVVQVGNWQSLGCHFDSLALRTLQGGTYQDWAGMTVEKCLELAYGYLFAGVEFWGYVS
jgi:hypothetical protein